LPELPADKISYFEGVVGNFKPTDFLANIIAKPDRKVNLEDVAHHYQVRPRFIERFLVDPLQKDVTWK